MRKGFSVSLPLLETLCVSALWYVDTIVTFLSSRHFSTVTGTEYLAMISPFPNFLSFTSLGMFLLFSFSVSTQSVECLIFSFLANSGLLKKLSICSVCPQPNKASKSFSYFGVSGIIRLDCRIMFSPYIYENTTNILFLVHIVRKILFWTLKPLVVGTALLTDAPSRVSRFQQWQRFGLEDTEFETLCSNDISQNKFWTM